MVFAAQNDPDKQGKRTFEYMLLLPALCLSLITHFRRYGFCTVLGLLLFLPGEATAGVVTDTLPGTPAIAPPSTDSLRSMESLVADSSSVSPITSRVWLVGAVNGLGYGGTLVLLNNAWYKNEARSSFHTFDDSKEWLMVDKFGHGWTAYNTGRATTAMWEWAGLPRKKAAIVGSVSGFAFLTGIEFLDAYSTKWGWSWSDIGANILGSGLFLGQELGFGRQVVQYKFSFHSIRYKDPQLEMRADDLFGSSWYERMLKDYNAQTYWFSVNTKSILPKTNLPDWLNIAVGYGAGGMFGGFENKWVDELGNDIVRNDQRRTRQFYLSPDIDFTKIKTKSKFLRTAFSALNAFKFPAPALMLDSRGKLKAYAIYF